MTRVPDRTAGGAHAEHLTSGAELDVPRAREAVSTPTWRLSPSVARALLVASYALLGGLLVWSRLVKLGQPLCCDEVLTVDAFVRRGPATILWGDYLPNNHELFSLAGWATTSLFGESAIVLRLWSVLPFIAGVVLVTAWLHVRVGQLSGVVYLFLATASPLLIDSSRQARGYGLAFLAMSVVVVAALEAHRDERTWAITLFCASGVVGTLILPHFLVAFLTIGAVLLTCLPLRRRCAVGLALASLTIAAWYLPHARAILETPRQDYGAAIETRWLVTAPLDRTLVPAVTQGDDAFLRPNWASLVIVLTFAALMSASLLLRARVPALVLCSGVVTTIAVVWLTGAEVVPRFFGFLLVPIFMLVASGAAAALALRTRAPRLLLTIAVAALLFVALVSASLLANVARFPRESLGAVAAAIQAEAPSSTPVYAYTPYPRDLVSHLHRPVRQPRTPAAAADACRQRRPVFFVEQRWLMTPADLGCTARKGVRHLRFRQYARGGRVDLWLIPPAHTG